MKRSSDTDQVLCEISEDAPVVSFIRGNWGRVIRAKRKSLLHVPGAEIGFFSVLHTWNQKLQHHPHVHCVVAAGGLSPDHTYWVHPRRRHHVLGSSLDINLLLDNYEPQRT
jgi:Putative transposase